MIFQMVKLLILLLNISIVYHAIFLRVLRSFKFSGTVYAIILEVIVIKLVMFIM